MSYFLFLYKHCLQGGRCLLLIVQIVVAIVVLVVMFAAIVVPVVMFVLLVQLVHWLRAVLPLDLCW